MTCSCFQHIDEQLKAQGCRLMFNMLADPPRAIVSTYVPDRMRKRGRKPPIVEASYCPFCGSRYPRTKDMATKLAPKSPRRDGERANALESQT